MKYRDQKALRAGSLKYLSLEGCEFLFDLAKDARERANLSRRYPEKLAELKAHYIAWEASVPPIPEDAGISLVYDRRNMAMA